LRTQRLCGFVCHERRWFDSQKVASQRNVRSAGQPPTIESAPRNVYVGANKNNRG
jgi:hypothetical protein